MRKFETPIFVSMPALVFLLVAAALVFMRQQTPKPHPWSPPNLIDTLAKEPLAVDSMIPIPDSLNPFIQMVDLDEVTDRVKAVQQCGSCHQTEYKNWSEGPHANAYRSMRKLYETASDSALHYFPSTYGKWIHSNMEICFQCHATENLYESNFKGVELELDDARINDSIFPELHKMGKPRKDPKTFTTGVDCITCHYNGERVITGPSFKPNPADEQMPGYCNPLPTPFFTTNTNCFTCHTFASETEQANLDCGMTFSKTNCIACHLETDRNTADRHFEDWRFADHARHPNLPAKGGIFESMKMKVITGAQARLVVDWANTVSPHGLTECGEVVLEIRVQNQNGKQVLQKEIRLNRKAAHDEHLRKQLQGEEPPGIVGYPFDPSDAAIHEEFSLLGKGIQKGKIILTAHDKAQYWGDDKIGVEIYKKEIAF